MDEKKAVTGNDIEIRGCRVHYQQAGEGKNLVLIHGLGGPLMWQRVMEPLSETFRVTAIHLPGFGESPCPPHPMATADYAMLCSRMMTALGIERTIVAGISYGGQCAAELAIRAPHQVERLVLLCSTGLPQTGVVAWPVSGALIRALGKHVVLRSRLLMKFSSRRSFHDIRSRPHDLVKEYSRQIWRNGNREVWACCVKEIYRRGNEFRQRLASVSVPTLILWGENDRLIPVRHATEMARLISGSTVMILRECGHSIPLEKPEETCRRIEDFSHKE